MKPDLYIARRYLVAKKSLGVIHVISTISAVGMVIGTAALILILSIYNGFDRIIRDNISDLDPDVLVTAVHGKYFVPERPAFDALLDDPHIVQVSSVLEEEVFLHYDGRQELARAKGVDAVYEEESRLASHVLEGTFALHVGDIPQAAVGAGLAYKLGIHPRFTEPLVLYFPRRGARIPLAGPAAALGSVKLHPGCLLSIGASEDEQLLLVPIDQMRTLLGLQGEVSGIELRLDGPADRRRLRALQELLGPEYRVQDRYQQHPALYKMMRYEKLAIYLILLFVVIIIATNILGSLSMLAIAKREDMQTLHALGADDRLIRRIFIWEGWLVSLVGLVGGLLLGVGLALLQQHFGLVKMPGGFALEAYPVLLQASDLLWTTLGVAGVGILISLLAAPRSQATEEA
ncbi:MAG: ABC transporter permease [Bacteroidales bacterium]|nr:ABC transporter permease [Bacteroidales bacterium]